MTCNELAKLANISRLGNEIANISGLGNELAKVAYVCFMCTSEAYQLIYEFQLYCGFHQPSSDS